MDGAVDASPVFAILGGQWGIGDPSDPWVNYDGRVWGDVDYAESVVQRWLIDMVGSWTDLVPPAARS